MVPIRFTCGAIVQNSSSNAVRVTPASPAGAPSRARKQFNSLVKKLEAERAHLAQWHAVVPQVRARADAELEPLCTTFWERRKALVFLLDEQARTQKLTARQQEKLIDVICTISENLLIVQEDAELEALLDLLLGPEEDDADDETALENAMLQDMFGIEIDQDLEQHGSPEQIRAAIDAAMRARLEEEERADAPGPKPGKPSARELRQQAEAVKLQQSVRDIFRKLTSALHPDREQDPAERARKTALMQRVNVAYGANDLLGLLELQMEIEQIDQASLDCLDEARIKQFNKILSQQLEDIEREVIHFEMALLEEFQLPMMYRPTPAGFAAGLDVEIAAMHRRIATVDHDLVALRDVKQLKAFLKVFRVPD